ncbi:amidase [Ignatzschineria rhizosphaerae]|uniref:Amidase n=1 Tax=Ignatzschineria rhizosphaerae TaxID=2923279 RepID=A0ABY3X2N6_9GAMM|nr:amidase [Ignatzschineria rhizosphaerae]UNM97149.1 amidase [Ignatzschineria rhizosphaerae]
MTYKTPLHYLSAQELAEKIQQREITSKAVTEHFLNRICKYNPEFSAYTTVFKERALALAENADRLLAAGIILSPFHGVPISVKEHFQWKGSTAHYGSKARLDCISQTNSRVVDRLIALGMPILGKTAMTEFAFGLAGQNPTMGTAHNPWSLETLKSPGGSSAGAGVALALGLCPIALGGDTGGSVRAPAAHTYNVGFKPSSGMISRANAMPLSPTLDVVGVVSRTVQDSAIMTELLTFPDLEDSLTLSEIGLTAQTNFMQKEDKPNLPKLYVLSEATWPMPVNTDYKAYWLKTLKQLESTGYELIEWAPHDSEFFKSLGDYNSVILAYEAYQIFGELAEDPNAELWLTVRNRILNGKTITKDSYHAALDYREECQSLFQAQFPNNGVLLMPAMDQAAQELDFDDIIHTGLGAFLRPANFIDCPAITLPSGLDSDFMPLSIQLLAHRAQDRALLAMATKIESTLGNTRETPDIA